MSSPLGIDLDLVREIRYNLFERAAAGPNDDVVERRLAKVVVDGKYDVREVLFFKVAETKVKLPPDFRFVYYDEKCVEIWLDLSASNIKKWLVDVHNKKWAATKKAILDALLLQAAEQGILHGCWMPPVVANSKSAKDGLLKQALAKDRAAQPQGQQQQQGPAEFAGQDSSWRSAVEHTQDAEEGGQRQQYSLLAELQQHALPPFGAPGWRLLPQGAAAERSTGPYGQQQQHAAAAAGQQQQRNNQDAYGMEQELQQQQQRSSVHSLVGAAVGSRSSIGAAAAGQRGVLLEPAGFAPQQQHSPAVDNRQQAVSGSLLLADSLAADVAKQQQQHRHPLLPQGVQVEQPFMQGAQAARITGPYGAQQQHRAAAAAGQQQQRGNQDAYGIGQELQQQLLQRSSLHSLVGVTGGSSSSTGAAAAAAAGQLGVLLEPAVFASQQQHSPALDDRQQAAHGSLLLADSLAADVAKQQQQHRHPLLPQGVQVEQPFMQGAQAARITGPYGAQQQHRAAAAAGQQQQRGNQDAYGIGQELQQQLLQRSSLHSLVGVTGGSSSSTGAAAAAAAGQLGVLLEPAVFASQQQHSPALDDRQQAAHGSLLLADSLAADVAKQQQQHRHPLLPQGVQVEQPFMQGAPAARVTGPYGAQQQHDEAAVLGLRQQGSIQDAYGMEQELQQQLLQRSSLQSLVSAARGSSSSTGAAAAAAGHLGVHLETAGRAAQQHSPGGGDRQQPMSGSLLTAGSCAALAALQQHPSAQQLHDSQQAVVGSLQLSDSHAGLAEQQQQQQQSLPPLGEPTYPAGLPTQKESWITLGKVGLWWQRCHVIARGMPCNCGFFASTPQKQQCTTACGEASRCAICAWALFD